MVDAPERIWASGGKVGSWNDQCVDAEVETEYVRADLASSVADENIALLQEITRLQEQLEAVTRERDEARSTFDARIQDMSEKFRAVNVAEALRQLGPDRLAQIERFQAAEARAARLEAALREARGHFIVERHDDGRVSGIGHDSQALPKIVGILDAALSEDSVKEAG